MKWTCFGLAAVAACMAYLQVPYAQAASPVSVSLQGFSGDSSQPGTQAAVGAAGLNFFSTNGFNDNGTPGDPGDDSNPAVTFNSSGAHFGALIAGDAGRNYMRTNDSDYATVPFRAQITFNADDTQAVFFGIGAGDTALFGTPDWSTQFSSASFWPETSTDKFTRFRTQNDINTFGDTGVPGFDPGTHRFRMTFNPSNNQLLGQIDINSSSGPFVPDTMTTNFPIVLTSLFAPDGWPTEPSRIFFGGDDGVTFKHLRITVIPEPSSIALVLLGVVALFGPTIRGKH